MGKMEKALLLILMLSGLPLLGVLLIGQPLVRYTEFPPETRYVQHPPFSWPMFVALALGLLLLAAPVIYRTVTSCLTGHEQDRVIHAFPWWGGLGVVLTAISWVLAWNRFPRFVDFQPFTFTPLWLGYILTVNAWTYRRTGHCMMLNRPRYFLWLFPLSAAFWWFFEYLIASCRTGITSGLTHLRHGNTFFTPRFRLRRCFPPCWARWNSWPRIRRSAPVGSSSRRFGLRPKSSPAGPCCFWPAPGWWVSRSVRMFCSRLSGWPRWG